MVWVDWLSFLEVYTNFKFLISEKHLNFEKMAENAPGVGEYCKFFMTSLPTAGAHAMAD